MKGADLLSSVNPLRSRPQLTNHPVFVRAWLGAVDVSVERSRRSGYCGALPSIFNASRKRRVQGDEGELQPTTTRKYTGVAIVAGSAAWWRRLWSEEENRTGVIYDRRASAGDATLKIDETYCFRNIDTAGCMHSSKDTQSGSHGESYIASPSSENVIPTSIQTVHGQEMVPS